MNLTICKAGRSLKTGRWRPTVKFKKPEEIRVGVVGYGGAYNMGKKHLEEIKRIGMTPAAVADADPSRLEVAKADFHEIETYSSTEAMLKKSDVNLVIIITPHNSHAPLALKCLRAGRHVVCEKPLATSTAQVNSMIAVARRNKLMLSTYHNRHWDGWILDAVELVREKRIIGDIVRIDCRMGVHKNPGDWWRSSLKISGGALYDWGVHLIEYTLQLIDSPAVEVSGFAHRGYWSPKTKWGEDCIEDEATAVVRFQSGQRLTLTITHVDHSPREGFMEITGTQGTYLIDWSGRKIVRRQGDHILTEEAPHSPGKQHLYYENIRDHLLKGTPLIITPEWSRRPIHFIELAMRSAKSRRALPVKYR